MRVRLLKVVIQPTFVVDDGENLVELPTKPLQLSTRDWEQFAADGLDRIRVELEKKLENKEEE